MSLYEIDRSLAELSGLVVEKPDYAEAWICLGVVMASMDAHDASMETLEKGVQYYALQNGEDFDTTGWLTIVNQTEHARRWISIFCSLDSMNASMRVFFCWHGNSGFRAYRVVQS